MASYQIEWKKSALKELKQLDRAAVSTIVKAVGQLAINPRPRGVKKLTGSDITYRLRVGDYRVVYDVYETRLVVEIIRVRHRKDAYR